MKKLINFSGGRGYYVDDVKILQEQFDMLKQVFNAFANRGFIVSGCEVTPTVTPGLYNVSGGLVYLAGELVEVRSGQYQFDGTNKAYISTVLDNGFDGEPFQFRNYDIVDELRKAFEYRYGRIDAVQPLSGAYVVLSTSERITWLDYLKLLLTNEETLLRFDDWQQSPELLSNFRKDFQGYVRFSESSYLGSSGNGETTEQSYTLPVGYRPLIEHTFDVIGVDSLNQTKRYFVRISASGLILATTNFQIQNGVAFLPLRGIFFKAA